MFNLLSEPLVTIQKDDGSSVLACLPETFTLLMNDEVLAFPALRPHQRHSWHAFLVQLAAMAIHQAGVSEPPMEAAKWAGLIRGLTPEFPDDEPWHLVVDDITRPAFMQAPARSKDREKDYKSAVATPDELDMLVTSNNHDLKAAVAERAEFDDWIFALITLQTMEGYGGKYNYGISRMPSGYGNRPAFSFSPSTRPGIHVKHDLVALLRHRHTLLDEYPMTDSGITLLWVIPWDGTKAESKLLTKMEPYYIEVCRRVRLTWRSGYLSGFRANSEARRIVDAKGLTGDPWTPVNNNTNPKGTPLAFLGPRKFGYARVVDGLLSPDWKPSLLLRPPHSDGDMQLVARGMVRGKGGTEGYHERTIPLRPMTIRAFGRVDDTEELADIARSRIKDIALIQSILRNAVWTFAAGGKTKDVSDKVRALANPWGNKLDELVDVAFFDDLQTEFEAERSRRTAIRKVWLKSVTADARGILRDAEHSLPRRTIHRYRAHVRASQVFEGRIQRELMAQFDASEEG